MQGLPLASHVDNGPSYMPSLDPGRTGGGTLTGQSLEPTLEAYENIFGPSARDIKQDLQRFKRHGRWHLPDILKGPNQYLTDRVDGLITDATASAFTSRILPYKYITNVDGKIKWNVWSFDEGLSSRVPYESAARTLTQSKRSFNGYTIRQGMGIVLEHNFLMSDAGRQNFKNQLNQLIGSIQLTNDLDVHVALVLAPSYQKTMQERYMSNDKTPTQLCREFVDMFGFVQKNQNALDILIEEAKGQLRTWGAPMPDFMLCNSKLTFQLTMTPDATNYATRGPDGAKRLKTGPDLPSYRGIDIIHTRAFSMETGAQPRDILRRRVRVAEYYRIPPSQDNHRRLFQLYNEERDTWSTFTFQELLEKAICETEIGANQNTQLPGVGNAEIIKRAARMNTAATLPSKELQMLGMPFAAAHGDNALLTNLSELFTQIVEHRLPRDFFWDVQFLSPNVVYVAGAMDNSKSDADYSFTDVLLFPAFMRGKLTESGGPSDIASKNTLRVQTQAVATYPRDQRGFHEAITAGDACDKFKFPDTFMPMAVDPLDNAVAATQILNNERSAIRYAALLADKNAATAHAEAEVLVNPVGVGAHTAQVKRLQLKMATRNYNRYGVPRGAVKGEWKSSGKKEINAALNMSYDYATDKHLDQYLREYGAFQCPNHYKEKDLGLPFAGDRLGYNTLMTQELLELLTKEHADVAVGDRNTYHNCLLFHIVSNPAKYSEILIPTTTAALKIANDTPGLKRHTLGKFFTENLRDALEGAAAANRFTVNSNAADVVPYWLWPRTESSRNDVFSTECASGWQKKMRDFIPKFHEDLDITMAVIEQMRNPKVAFPDNTELTMPVEKIEGEITDRDATRFFNMLAWRLWGDQEVGLYRVYTATTGVWPNPSQYLVCDQSSGGPFGEGVMMYRTPPSGAGFSGKTPAAAMASTTKDIEVVIVRPNIEHYMMGIILGQGGESLGSTFWGQVLPF